MICFTDEATRQFALQAVKEYGKSDVVLFNFDAFIKKCVALNSFNSVSYPQTVRIPKGLPHLLTGDFEPSREFVINEPLKDTAGNTIWYADSRDGVSLRFGYNNGDSSLVSDVRYAKTEVHALLAGKTGMGKSNTINTILASLMTEYAPWELELYLLDAKKVEFLPFASTLSSPHIKSVAATEDPDYMISLLEDVIEDMNKWNSIFPLAGASKNIADFRNTTGLNVPQKVIVFDEFQTAMKNEKHAAKIITIIEKFGRLGRNTGYHLLLASQGLDSSISGDLLDQFKIRMALPIGRAMSEKLLKNTGASRIFERGEMLVNTNTDDEDAGEANNDYFKVPFIPSSSLERVTKDSRDVGEMFGAKIDIASYSDDDKLYETRFLKDLDKMRPRLLPGMKEDFRFYIGEPVFIYRDMYKYFNIQFKDRDLESILISSNTAIGIERLTKTVLYNLRRLKKFYPDRMKVCFCYSDYDYSEFGFDRELCDLGITRISNYTDAGFQQMVSSIFGRLLALNVDQKAFGQMRTTDASEKIFNELLKLDDGTVEDTKINRVRCYYLLQELKDTTKYKTLAVDPSRPTPQLYGIIRATLRLIKNLGCSNCQLTVDKLPMQFNVIGGLNSILGFGIDPRDKAIDGLKNAIVLAKDVRVKFILISKHMEGMRGLTKVIGHFIVDQASCAEAEKCGIINAPTSIIKGLCLYRNQESSDWFKLKYLSLNKELEASEVQEVVV